jgi:EAL domain-containing protein (putative c-di-GMP-specific phosphodiesterase class I)
MLAQLTALGVSVALDDFGMGHSSLAYLRDLPVSRLKIDRTFIRGVMHSESDAVLAKAVMGLARTLGKTVVAEGVETQAQLDFLCEHRCESYQGWLFSRAVAADEVPVLLRKTPPVGAAEGALAWPQLA